MIRYYFHTHVYIPQLPVNTNESTEGSIWGCEYPVAILPSSRGMKYIALKLHWGPSITYTYEPGGKGGGGGGGGQISYTFPFLLTYTNGGGGGEGVQIVCKLAYVLNGRPLNMNI